jgi:ppGpp synthetase/RelA/SpoT-type nucleotidyltranferase
MVPLELAQKHELVLPYLRRVESLAGDKISAFCHQNSFAYLARLKTQQSVADKLEQGRFRTWEEIDDLFACAIIVPSVTHEDGVMAFLRGEFEIVMIRSRGSTQKDPSAFRFDATRVAARLKRSPKADAESADTKVSFEVQIRTAFEHAWQVATHSVAYKGQSVDWRALRLAAQLKAAVEQLDTVMLSFDQTRRQIRDQRWPDVVSRKRIVRFFVAAGKCGLIPVEALPEDWMRFSENLLTLFRKSANSKHRRFDALRNTNLYLRIVARVLRGNGFKYPRSLTPYQLVLSTLVEHSEIDPENFSLVLPITDALRTFTPKVSALRNSFDFQLSPADGATDRA